MKRILALLLVLCMLAPAALAVSAGDLMAQCDAYVAAGDYASALASFELARLIDPAIPYDACTIGTVYLNNGDTANALQCAKDATSTDPSSAEAWALMAAVCTAIGDTSGAQQAQLYLSVLQAAAGVPVVPTGATVAKLPATVPAPVDPVIDELFARGSISLKQQSFLPGMDAAPISLSPDGQTGLFFTEEGFYLAKRGDTASRLPVQPSQTRGVADALGKIQRLVNNRNIFGQARTPAVWSPDGRYVTLEFANLAYMQMQMLVDPFVIDTQTGEWIIFETGASKKQDGAIVYGCFSPDSTKLYYAYYATSNPRFSIRCADLATGEISLLYSSDNAADFMPGWPGLFMTETGSLICLNDSAKYPVGVNFFVPENGAMSRTKLDFGVDRTAWYPSAMAYSAKSGYALLGGIAPSDGGSYTFKVFRIQDDQPDAAAFAKLYGFVGESTPTLVAYDDTVITILAGQKGSFLANWQVNCIRMSPCGQYAVAACMYNQQHALVLIRLEDMACQTIALPDGLQAGYLGTRKYSYLPGFVWAGDSELLITTDNGMRLYTLE